MTRRQSRLLATTTLAATLLWLLIAPAQTSMELAGIRTLVDDEIEVVYQAPASTPRGVLLILHGCSHRATDAWPKSDDARMHGSADRNQSRGKRSRQKLGRRRRPRATTAGAAAGRSATSRGSERPRVTYDASRTRARRPSRSAPRRAGPSPCSFLMLLRASAQIMASPFELDARHPPVRFVHMARDTHRAAMIHHQVSVLKERGVDAAELIVEPEPPPERPGPAALLYFAAGPGPAARCCPDAREMAEKAFQALRDGG